MEEDTFIRNECYSITRLNKVADDHVTIKRVLNDLVISKFEKMAIKESLQNACVYSVPVKPSNLSYMNNRNKSIQEAKNAFLNATVNPTITFATTNIHTPDKQSNTLHYAEIALTTESNESKDSRSTGGGINDKGIQHSESKQQLKRESEVTAKMEQQHRKVSFKIKNTLAHKRPPLSTKTMKITGNKVSELTNKFNNLVQESHGPIKSSKLVKTIENLQRSSSNSSTPSSTLSSNSNIKIVFRHRRGSKKRTGRKRCSSVDSIDKIKSEYIEKIRVIRSISDGTKKRKSPKKRLKYLEEKNSSDYVDGALVESDTNVDDCKSLKSNVVKNNIKRFECEINAQSISNVRTNNKYNTKNIATNITTHKPKVPEKKVSLLVTKNVVIKDGVPKIKTIKTPIVEPQKKLTDTSCVDLFNKRKESTYDKNRYKTNYIHTEKLPLHVVDIIHEEINESQTLLNFKPIVLCDNKNEEQEKMNQGVSSQMTPNQSFLWSRKSPTTPTYPESEKSVTCEPYGLINNDFDNSEGNLDTLKLDPLRNISINIENSEIKCHDNLDFETNLVEAYNKEVLVGITVKPPKDNVENYYEPLEPIQISNNVNVIPVINNVKRHFIKINCPLPEIPKFADNECQQGFKENIYQSLLEMRSHPEGDESSHHSYELCSNEMVERTRGDGDSDDGYEYCKNPIKPYCQMSSSGLQITEYQHLPPDTKNYVITKSLSETSTISYEKIGQDSIYEVIPPSLVKPKNNSQSLINRQSSASSDYTNNYNEGENIYDTIKQADAVSLSHCYESIPNSPSLVKLRNNLKKQLVTAVQKRLSFDQESTISQCTISSEQKTNSIYGQRSIMSFNGQEITFPVANSETSASDRSDRSDDWVDVSDEEKYDEQKIIIVQERSRGRKSPISWSQKVRHQWHNNPQQCVSVTSSSKVYFDTSIKAPYYSQNDEDYNENKIKSDINEVKRKILETLEQSGWMSFRTVLRDGNVEIQDLVTFIDGDNDPCHLYESLDPAPEPIDEDFDSFDSDTDTDDPDSKPVSSVLHTPPMPRLSQLPDPPGNGSGPYTLTKIASAAQRKMRELKRNITKKYSVAVDGKPFNKLSLQINGQENKHKNKSPYNSNYENITPPQTIYARSSIYGEAKVNNVNNEPPIIKVNGFRDELKSLICEKRNSNTCYGEVPPPLPEKPPTPTTEQSKGKDSGTLSRKTYFSFKSRFRRANSLAVDINTDVPSALKITNSTFYLTDSMDGDSGFSNCSDNGQTSGSAETLQSSAVPVRPARRDGTRLRKPVWSESSPCLTLERPGVPPPPPPGPQPRPTDLGAVNEELKRLLPSLSRKDKFPRTRTSWYAECGGDDVTVALSPRPSSTSWYAEAGLCQAGNISSSSGASSGSHPASPLPHSLFTHEPLYQFYNAAKVESACREIGDSDSDLYEPSGSVCSDVSTEGTTSRPSAMALIAPTRGPARTLWCEVPEVINSTVLSSLAPVQKRLQEAKFELLTSEASYLNSLNVLEAHFIAHPAFRDPHLLSRTDREMLFSSISPVRKCSQLLMNELEKCWQENILLQGLCDIVRHHAEEHFHVYVKYCESQSQMSRSLQRLRLNPLFSATLRKLEAHPSCQSLSLHSFLMLPMQRITRLPLLMDAVLRNLNEADEEYQSCMDALATLNNFVSQCNEGARNTDRVEEMFRLCRSIEFPPHMKDPPSLGPASSRRDKCPVRWLVRSGELTQMVWKTEDQLKLTFGKKFHKNPLYLFLFNDVLVITKKKSECLYVAVDYCARSLVEVCSGDEAAAGAKHPLLLTLLENHIGRTVEMVMSCPSATDASRWAEALVIPSSAAGEAVYAGWDCPQVAAIYAYYAAQPDELPLSEGDIVNVTRKTNEGWYYGERIRDGEAGWFPGSYTVEIASAHVRARNLRQRYRLLALSGTYLGQKKKSS